MDKAIRVISRQGQFKEVVDSTDITSRQNARNLSPLVDAENKNQLVNWISPCFKSNGKLKRRSHFRKIAKSTSKKLSYTDEEIERRGGESAEHKQAKLFIAEALKENLRNGIPMEWYFTDKRNTDLTLSGNYLAGASEIKTEYAFKTSLGNEFRVDIVILSEGLRRGVEKNFIICGIEIERSHSFGYRKEILCKSAGFPLVSVDISELSLEDITMEWAHQVLRETTKSNQAGYRSNYLYLHPILYPVYANFPDEFIKYNQEHQYIIFDNNESLDKTHNILKKLFNYPELPNSHANVSLINKKNTQTEKILANHGAIVGSGWDSFNDSRALLVTLKRVNKRDIADLKFNLAVVRTLLRSLTALICYKYEKGGVSDDNRLRDLWRYLLSKP